MSLGQSETIWLLLDHSGSDMNECAQGYDSCQTGQVCENTIGSYICRRTISCGTGYTLDRMTQQCLGMYSTVKPVLKDHPTGHNKNRLSIQVVCSMFIDTSSITLTCRTSCYKYVVFPDRWSLIWQWSLMMGFTVPQWYYPVRMY